eukprot:PhF_6_TR11206/c0_g1_i1/m.18068/K19619/TDP2; tyrosyl-DNA phosphodiesterase 2
MFRALKTAIDRIFAGPRPPLNPAEIASSLIPPKPSCETTTEVIRILTFNAASHNDGPAWQRYEEHNIRCSILNHAYECSGADVICLQETTTDEPAILDGKQYLRSKVSVATHAGNTNLYVRSDWSIVEDCETCIPNGRDPHFPLVVLQRGDTTLVVISVHLSPFASSAHRRAQQSAFLIDVMKQKLTQYNAATPNVVGIIAGDTNMQSTEGIPVEDNDWLHDVFGDVPESSDLWATFDVVRNDYNTTDGDRRPRVFRGRYDRVWVGKLPSSATSGAVVGRSLFGDKPVGSNPPRYLSDHYGVIVDVNVAKL